MMRVSMLRFLWGAFALACGIAQVLAGSAPPADDSGSAPMRFEWRREAPSDVCGSNCRTWISAVGYITADTPRDFEAIAADPNAKGAVLVLDSDGGSVLGTLALGRMIRIIAPLGMLREAALGIFEQLAHRYAGFHALDDLVENAPHAVVL